VHALAGQRIQVHRQRGGQGLAFAGAHLGNLAVVQDMPPSICTSKWRIFMTRLEPSRTTAKASGSNASALSPWATRLELLGLGAQLVVAELFRIRAPSH
jgi:hypothetical protein